VEEYKVEMPAGTILEEGKEIQLTVQNLGTMEKIEVKAVVYKEKQEKTADQLWLQYEDKYEPEHEPWWITILETFEEEIPEVKARPKPKTSLGKSGDILKTLLQRKEGQ